MVNRSIASFLALAVVAALVSPGLAALCADSSAQAHACCAPGSDCGRLVVPAEARCCEVAPIQAPAGSPGAIPSTFCVQAVAALPAAAMFLARAAAGDAGGGYAARDFVPDSLSALILPLRL
jgi:hypothetical protein